MGVFGGRDNFSSKWITAMIVDAQNRLHLVPIKNTVDDYFFATINKEDYCFKIDHGKILIWYATLTKSFRVLWYTTEHYKPISARDVKGLEKMLETNNLPKMNRLQLTILSQLARREKEPFKPHDLNKIINEMNKHPEKNTEMMHNVRVYLGELDTKQIITPIRKITEFLESDLIATDAKFVASVPDSIMRAEEENRRVTNSPIGTKRSWRLPIAILLGVALIGGIIALGISMGAFDNLTSGFGNLIPNTSGAPKTLTDWAAKFPTPESLRIGIDQGQVKESDLPNSMKDWLKQYTPPKATPKNLTIGVTP